LELRITPYKSRKNMSKNDILYKTLQQQVGSRLKSLFRSNDVRVSDNVLKMLQGMGAVEEASTRPSATQVTTLET
jgi:hypothetical protein